jgi:hypothetical protein
MPVYAIFIIYGHLLKARTQQFILNSRNLSRRFCYLYYLGLVLVLRSVLQSDDLQSHLHQIIHQNFFRDYGGLQIHPRQILQTQIQDPGLVSVFLYNLNLSFEF